MATSESDADFESADEEMASASVKRNIQLTYKKSTVDSESDSDTEYVDRPHCGNVDRWTRSEIIAPPHVARDQKVAQQVTNDNSNKVDNNVKVHESDVVESVGDPEKTFINQDNISFSMGSAKDKDTQSAIDKVVNTGDTVSKVETAQTGIVTKTTRQKTSKLGAKKLGTRLLNDKTDDKTCVMDNATEQQDERLDYFASKSLHISGEKGQLINDQPKSTHDLPEVDMPEELKSNKKFKEVFQLEGWEEFDDDIQLPDKLMEEKVQPEKLSLASKDEENSLGSWSNWGDWNVSSLIDTAAASMTTLSTHVSQGFTISKSYISQGLTQDPTETIKQDEAAISDDKPEIQEQQENQSYSSFRLGNLMSGVSSITKLVESTGSKVMTGGLDTLEAIGKKTMEVLQEGDPGLKKKRAFFTTELEKPILSQVLREAKERAETTERTAEEYELARKVHFESLFDDYQGLVHLEALEILSKQSSMKIQQYLIELDANELTSVQETLEEIRELCDLDEEHSDDEACDEDLKDKLQHACRDLGVDITYEQLHTVWIETENYLASSLSHVDQEEIFRNAVSTLAKFTAFSIERFHKTAELLLIKERRSTVNEADALVQLTNIISNRISSLANLFCQTLNQFAKTEDKSDKINANVTTIFMEASNANSYVQDAFKLLIPIVQVGSIC